MCSFKIPWDLFVKKCNYCGASNDACSFFHKDNNKRLICGKCHKYHKFLEDGMADKEDYAEFEETFRD